MPAAYNICIKCCVIKLFFTCIFWGAGSLTRQGDTIKPASAICSGSVAFYGPETTLPFHFLKGVWQWTLHLQSWGLWGGQLSVLMAVSSTLGSGHQCAEFQILGELASQNLAMGRCHCSGLQAGMVP